MRYLILDSSDYVVGSIIQEPVPVDADGLRYIPYDKDFVFDKICKQVYRNGGVFSTGETRDKPIVSYSIDRSYAYPPVGDQLDAIWKLLAAQPELLTPEATDLLAKIQQVKADNPKPNK